MSRRIENIRAGADELARWLVDTVQLGTAQRHGLSPQEWQSLAARMIDAQAKGLANRITSLSKLFEQANWQESVLQYIGELYMLCEAFRNYEQLSPALQNELLNQAGVGQRKKDILLQDGLADDWLVLGRKVRQEDRMEAQKTYLYSPVHQRFAMLLEFAFGRGSAFETHLEVGTRFQAEMVYYPAAFPLRAWFKEGATPVNGFTLPTQYASISEMQIAFARALQANPFLGSFPALIDGLIPYQNNHKLGLKDKAQDAIPLPAQYKKIWHLFAISGGQPTPVFGEWDGRQFTPLGMLDQQQWTRL
ncbi:MAG: hypothetical protein AAF927_09660 [Bacteroidota bacterium]